MSSADRQGNLLHGCMSPDSLLVQFFVVFRGTGYSGGGPLNSEEGSRCSARQQEEREGGVLPGPGQNPEEK